MHHLVLYILIVTSSSMGLRHHQLQMKGKFCLLRCISQSTVHNHIHLLKHKNCAYVSHFMWKEIGKWRYVLSYYTTYSTHVSCSFFLIGPSILVLITQNLGPVLILSCPKFQKIKSEFVNMVWQIIFVFFNLIETDCWLLKLINF